MRSDKRAVALLSLLIDLMMFLLPATGSASTLGKLCGGGSLAQRTNGRGLCSSRCGTGGTLYNPDEGKEHGPVNNAYDYQEDEVGKISQAESADQQVDQAGNQDICQRNRDKNQPGKLHQLVGAQARQRAAYPDEDEAEQVDLGHEVDQAKDVAKQAPAQ